MNKSFKITAHLFIAIMVTLLSSGCSSVKIRTANSLYNENDIKNIAVLGESRVEWPRMGNNEPMLGINESRKSLELLLMQAKSAFADKGYNVTLCEPAGISYNNPRSLELDVYNDDNSGNGGDEKDKIVNIRTGKVVYEYPIITEDEEFRDAVRNVFNGIESAVGARKLAIYSPSADDIAIINRKAGADAICFNRVFGTKFSTGRKAGAFAVGVVAAMFGSYVATPSDTVESHFTCVDTASGEVLWQHGVYATGDPTDPSDKFVSQVLESFPDMGSTMDKKYQ